MKKTITLIALAMVANLSYATNGSELNMPLLDLDKIQVAGTETETVENRVYYWEVENAYGKASGYSFSYDKVQAIITKASKGDYSRAIVVMSNPRK